MENEKTYVIRKHWFFWVFPLILSLFTAPTVICPIVIILWTYLRWRFDSIEVKDGSIYSRLGIINIDKKVIPLAQISMITEKTDIIGQLFHCGAIMIQSSAANNAIVYPSIDNPAECINVINKMRTKQ